MNNSFLEKSNISLLDFIDSIGDPVSIQGPDLKILYQNKAHREIIGEHAGEFCFIAYEGNDSPCDQCPVTKVFSDGGIQTSERSITLNGEQVYLEITASPLHTETGETIAAIEVIRDVTRKKNLEINLLESQERFTMITENTFDMIHLNDDQGHILYANSATEKLLGYSLDEVIGFPAEKFIHPEDHHLIRKDMASLFYGKNIPSRDVRLLKKNGEYLDVAVKGFAIQPIDGKKYIGAILRDITRRKEAERQLSQQAIKLEEANITLRRLLKETQNSKQELEENILASIRSLVSPNINELLVRFATSKEKALVESIKNDIDDLANSFSRNVSSAMLNLSPREIQVADFIRQGKVTKEIAEIISVSPRTVEYYRDNIRLKLGLKNKKINLRTYLLSLSS